MTFVRIKDNGYDRNGNHLNRVFIYERMDAKQFSIISKDRAKDYKFGRINADGSITTQWTKQEIIDKIAPTWYAFE